MADARLRRLERAAALGDPEAVARFEHFKEKTEIKPLSSWELIAQAMRNMSFSITELAEEFAGLRWTMTSTTTSPEFQEKAEAIRHTWLSAAQATRRTQTLQRSVRIDIRPRAREPPD